MIFNAAQIADLRSTVSDLDIRNTDGTGSVVRSLHLALDEIERLQAEARSFADWARRLVLAVEESRNAERARMRPDRGCRRCGGPRYRADDGRF